MSCRGVVGLVAYSGLLMVPAIEAAAGGHGFRFPLVLFFAPVSLALFSLPHFAGDSIAFAVLLGMASLWPALGVTLRAVPARARKQVGRGAVLVHWSVGLISAGLSIQPEELTLLRQPAAATFLVLPLAVYLTGQVAIWRTIRGGTVA